MKHGLQWAAMTAAYLLGSVPAQAADLEEWKGEAKDAWIDGKLETSLLLNTELNSFRIETHVENGAVTLSGEVPSQLQKDLAEHIAQSLNGVTSVNNLLVIGTHNQVHTDKDVSFRTRLNDMTTTARLKTEFAANTALSAREINIDTVEGVVTLQGKVESETAKQLAEDIARNYDNVKLVENRLVVGD